MSKHSNTSHCTIKTIHCEACGATDYYSLHEGDEGYTACCNQLSTSQAQCRNHHG